MTVIKYPPEDSGSGDVAGPASATNNNIAVYDGTTGKIIKDGGQTIAQVIAAAGDVDGPASAVDERVAVYNGTTGKIIKDGGQTIAQIIAAATGTPGGSDTQVQYNNSGAFGGDSAFTFDDGSDKRLTVTQVMLKKSQIDATGSSTGDPAGFTTSNWGSGNALKFELAGPDAVIRGANGNGNMQLDSYYGIVMMGGRQSNNPGFIASTGANVGTLIVPFASTDVPLIVRGAASQSAALQQWQTSGSANVLSVMPSGVILAPFTYTAAATTGDQTIDKPSGSVNFAAAATSLVVTSNKVTANSIVMGVVATNDSTMKSVAIVPDAGFFTIYANAAAAAETRVSFWVLNQ